VSETPSCNLRDKTDIKSTSRGVKRLNRCSMTAHFNLQGSLKRQDLVPMQPRFCCALDEAAAAHFALRMLSAIFLFFACKALSRFLSRMTLIIFFLTSSGTAEQAATPAPDVPARCAPIRVECPTNCSSQYIHSTRGSPVPLSFGKSSMTLTC
jgi:hypothetical protein